MTTPQYIAAAEQFQTDGYYEASELAAFNPATPEFGAFALFYILGSYQNAGLTASTPAPQFLWGNYDVVNNTGWRLMLGVSPIDSSSPALRLDLGDGSMNTYYSLFGTPQNGSGYIERLILAEFWQNEASLALAINGNIAIVDQAGSGPGQFSPIAILPSAKKARIGYGTDNDNEASFCGIVATGYSATCPIDIGAAVGYHFREARGSYSGGHIIRPEAGSIATDIDWTHRYEAASLVGLAYSVQQNTRSSQLTATPVPPSIWPDAGNGGYTAQPGISAVAFNYAGGGNTTPFFTSVKNIDWAMGLAPNVFNANIP